MGKFRDILSEYFELVEKRILINRNAQSDQLVALAGGGGSGKGFAGDEFLDLKKSYKVFNVDDVKDRLIKLAKKGKSDPRLANLNLKNARDVAYLHQYAKDNKIEDKILKNFAKGIDPKKGGKPNVAFDMVFKDMSDAEKRIGRFQRELGYKPEDTHLVWILTDFNVALKNNRERDRVVPDDILIKAHNAVAKTMGDILMDEVPSMIGGEIWIILNNRDQTIFYQDAEGNDIKTNKDGKKVIKDFTRIKVKDVGKPVDKKAVNNMVKSWMLSFVPPEAKADIRMKTQK